MQSWCLASTFFTGNIYMYNQDTKLMKLNVVSKWIPHVSVFSIQRNWSLISFSNYNLINFKFCENKQKKIKISNIYDCRYMYMCILLANANLASSFCLFDIWLHFNKQLHKHQNIVNTDIFQITIYRLYEYISVNYILYMDIF